MSRMYLVPFLKLCSIIGFWVIALCNEILLHRAQKWERSRWFMSLFFLVPLLWCVPVCWSPKLVVGRALLRLFTAGCMLGTGNVMSRIPAHWVGCSLWGDLLSKKACTYTYSHGHVWDRQQDIHPRAYAQASSHYHPEWVVCEYDRLPVHHPLYIHHRGCYYPSCNMAVYQINQCAWNIDLILYFL